MNRTIVKGLLLVSFLGVTMVPEISGQISRLPRPDSLGSAFFGTSVAIDGEWAVVGATGADQCGSNSGSVWVYRWSDGGWTLTDQLLATECEEGAFFGHAVDLSGERIVVSAFRTFVGRAVSNHVYVFERTDAGWAQTARIPSPDLDASGPFAAALALDGDHLLVTSSGDASGDTNGKGFLFEVTDGRWQLSHEFSSPLSLRAGTLGTSAALKADRVVIAGSTYSRNEPGFVATWSRDDGGRWHAEPTLRGIQGFFIDVDLHEDLLLVGEPRAGALASGSARLLRWSNTGWQLEATLKPRDAYQSGSFGTRVALGDGLALVAGFDEQLELDFNVDQVVYVFERSDATWTQRRILDIGESAFGASLDVADDRALIGQAADGVPGQAYVATVKPNPDR
ncbi:MAG: FG-GAP repeat protein [Bacteroidota bacterium]|nr:FG-GAP repeat protein [Bacteroidota bacterium]